MDHPARDTSSRGVARLPALGAALVGSALSLLLTVAAFRFASEYHHKTLIGQIAILQGYAAFLAPLLTLRIDLLYFINHSIGARPLRFSNYVAVSLTLLSTLLFLSIAPLEIPLVEHLLVVLLLATATIANACASLLAIHRAENIVAALLRITFSVPLVLIGVSGNLYLFVTATAIQSLAASLVLARICQHIPNGSLPASAVRRHAPVAISILLDTIVMGAYVPFLAKQTDELIYSIAFIYRTIVAPVLFIPGVINQIAIANPTLIGTGRRYFITSFALYLGAAGALAIALTSLEWISFTGWEEYAALIVLLTVLQAVIGPRVNLITLRQLSHQRLWLLISLVTALGLTLLFAAESPQAIAIGWILPILYLLGVEVILFNERRTYKN